MNSLIAYQKEKTKVGDIKYVVGCDPATTGNNSVVIEYAVTKEGLKVNRVIR